MSQTRTTEPTRALRGAVQILPKTENIDNRRD